MENPVNLDNEFNLGPFDFEVTKGDLSSKDLVVWSLGEIHGLEVGIW